jgi:hypothetical protein
VAALNGDTVTSNTNVTYFDFEVPVAQWAGNGTVNLGPGAQVQYLYNSSGITAAGASDTTSFAYGPGGVAIGNIASTTANSVTSFRVRSLYPIQATDLIVLELDQGSSGARWFEAGMLRAGPIYQSTSIYGVYFTQINSTDLDVNFGNKGFVSNNAIYAGDGATWTSISTWRWRVRIVQPSSPVGYGLVDTNSSGLQRAYSSMTKIRLNTGNGYGSTSTCIRRFTNTVVNTGSGITYADSSTAGASFTCTEAGIYCFSYDDAFSAGANFGLSLNSSQLTTAINSITASDRLVMATTSAAAGFQCVSVTVALAVGDVVRPHADATTESVAPARVHFTVQRIA